MQRTTRSLYAGVLLAVLGVVAWGTGQPFVFPSLGPSAFLLAVGERFERPRRTIVGSHAIGALAGFVTYAAIGADVTLVTATPALSAPGFRLAASGVLSVVLTTWGMLATDTSHAPACATTLIVSLGLLSTPVEAAIIVVSVAVLVETDRTVDRIRGVNRNPGT